MENRPIRAREVAPVVAIIGALLVVLMMLALCFKKDQSLQDCDPNSDVRMLALGLVTATFAWLSKPPD